MRVVDLVPEEHFSEGEPDLEPPEELALGELDDETMLEEEIDNEGIREEDVDDEVLTVTLEHLAHADDGDDDEDAPVAPLGFAGFAGVEEVEAMEVLDVDEIEDLEESLDRLLAQRLAMDGDEDEAPEAADATGAGEAGEAGDLVAADASAADGHRGAAVDFGLRGHPGLGAQFAAGCGAEEFVCSGCFLVRNRAQLADATIGLCRDCAS